MVYGDDFDNNGMVDYRENDNLPDYAYPLDHRGFHTYGTVEVSRRTQLKTGLYRVRQPVMGGRNHTEYVEGQYRRDWPGLGYLRLNHRVKWMEDDIRNTVYNIGSVGSLRPDRLGSRDTVSNYTFFETGLMAVPDVNLRNIITFGFSELEGDPVVDPFITRPGRYTGVTVMNKVDYTWRRGRLTVRPQFKHIYYRSTSPR